MSLSRDNKPWTLRKYLQFTSYRRLLLIQRTFKLYSNEHVDYKWVKDVNRYFAKEDIHINM